MILGNTELINKSTNSTIGINGMVSNIEICRGDSESGETIATVTSDRPIRERARTKVSGTFRLTSVTDNNLEETRSIMIRSSSTVTLSNRISSFVIVNVTTMFKLFNG
jgi:hypothetical protein